MSVHSRVAFASGVAGAVGSALLLSGRFEGSVVLVLLLVIAIRTAVPAALVDAGPVLAAGAERALKLRASVAPVWALVVAVAVVRAGSTEIGDVRGVNAVAGLALLRGPFATVAAAWLATVAVLVAIAVTAGRLGGETAASAGAIGRIVVPSALRRLDLVGVVAETALAVSLFAGPQIDGPLDAFPWVAGAAAAFGVAAVASRTEAARDGRAPGAAAILGAVAVVLVLIGGPP